MGTEDTRGPLEELVRILRRGIPRLSVLMERLGGAEDYGTFVGLVREYLPDVEEEILSAGSPDDVVQAFATAFGERYFPIDEAYGLFEGEEFEAVINFMPVAFHGIDLDGYHYLVEWRAGFLLGAVLVDFETELCLDGEGIRTTVMETLERTVSREVLERLPAQGYSLEFLRLEVPTELVGLVRIAEYLCHDTRCVFFDYTNEDMCGGPPQWNRETVEFLTEQWAVFQVIDAEMADFVEWIEESPEARFGELVRFLERRTNGRRARIALGAAPGNRGAAR